MFELSRSCLNASWWVVQGRVRQPPSAEEATQSRAEYHGPCARKQHKTDHISTAPAQGSNTQHFFVKQPSYEAFFGSHMKLFSSHMKPFFFSYEAAVVVALLRPVTHMKLFSLSYEGFFHKKCGHFVCAFCWGFWSKHNAEPCSVQRKAGNSLPRDSSHAGIKHPARFSCRAQFPRCHQDASSGKSPGTGHCEVLTL